MGYPYSHEKEVPILSKHFGDPEARTLQGWKKRGGYDALKKALAMSPKDVVEIAKASGLRGRGGAGFPTGLKWSFMPKDKSKPHYLLCNADESEPGTFKDRELLRWVPHQLIEGCLIGAYAMGAEHVYIYCRGEFFEATQVLAKAVGKSRSHIANTLRLLGLPEAVKSMVLRGDLSAGHARALLGAEAPSPSSSRSSR